MIKRMLVPLDGSEIATRILTQAGRLFSNPASEVVLVRVLATNTERQKVDEARRELQALKERVSLRGPHAAYRILAGDPAEQIARLVNQDTPSLVAISTNGQTGARGTRGRVAEHLLRASAAPVLLTNPFEFDRTEILDFRRVLVPFDGTTASAEILPLAVEVARTYGAELVFLHVVEMPEVAYPPISLSIAESDAKPLIELYRTRFQLGDVRIRVALGSAADAILETAIRENVDLLAMTTHGSSARSRASAFGPVADKVVRGCRCPVLLKRTADEVATPTGRVSVLAVG